MAGFSELQLKQINDNPINNALDDFRTTFKSTYPEIDVSGPLIGFERVIADSVGKSLVLRLLGTLQLLPAASTLHSEDGNTPLSGEIAFLYARLSSNQTKFEHVFQLLRDIIAGVEDMTIWTTVIDLITQTKLTPRPTTPTQPIASFPVRFQQTPWSYNTSHFVDTSELRRDVDPMLKSELQSNLIIDHPEFFNKFFVGVPQLGEIAAAVFEICQEAETPLYQAGPGWVGWPEDCEEFSVLQWLRERFNQFLQFANDQGFHPPPRRRCFASPNNHIPKSISKRKLDISIVYDRTHEALDAGAVPENMTNDLICDWSDVLVPGELKSNPREDNRSSTWLDLSRYAREIFSAEDTRRSVMGFTLCGSTMRLWEFDRLGGISSQPFNIQKDGLMFVSAVLGFLWMTEKDLGFDPTVYKHHHGRYIEISPEGRPEQLHLDKVIMRQRCIAGRATTCWKAYRNGDEPKCPFVVKDSWEDEERPEEGLLLKKVTEAGVENVAEYYYHETVSDGGAIVDVRHNVRKGLEDDVGKYPFQEVHVDSDSVTDVSKPKAPVVKRLKTSSQGRSRSSQQKRSSSSRQASMPPSKRSCSNSRIEEDQTRQRRNRVHRRLIMRRAGKRIYDASSLAAMITGILGGVKGHESLLERHVLHRDISVGNIMLEETEDDGFLIDLDLAIEMDRQEASGATSKTGTKVFMAIGALRGEHHSFIHDLESFFWVLFWLGIHCTGPGGQRRVPEFEEWNYKTTEDLAKVKIGSVLEEKRFNQEVEENFTDYCKPLIPCLQELRQVIFPGGQRRLEENREVYWMIRSVLEKARNHVMLQPQDTLSDS